MGTVALAPMRALAKFWEDECGFGSAVLSGIVGDLSHLLRGGYHISREDQPADNYSVKRPQDKPGQGPNNAAAAIDMTMNTADMKACTARLRKVYDDQSDPRRAYLNAFNGWTGSGNAQRWDIYAQTVSTATADHKWHVHAELRRFWVDKDEAMRAIRSILKGESKEQFSGGAGGGSPSGAPPYPGRLLRRNDAQRSADAAVRQWQARMLESGWAALGKADGYFGPKMEMVVKTVQRQNGQAADGVIGPKTWPLPWGQKKV